MVILRSVHCSHSFHLCFPGLHTTEILSVSTNFPTYPRVYVGATSDLLSHKMARKHHYSLLGKEAWPEVGDSSYQEYEQNVKFLQTCTAREVGQSWITVLLYTGPLALLNAFDVLVQEEPSLVSNEHAKKRY